MWCSSDYKVKKSSFSLPSVKTREDTLGVLSMFYYGPDVLHSLCNYLTMRGGMKQSSLVPNACTCFMTFYAVTACRYEKFRAFVNNVRGISM